MHHKVADIAAIAGAYDDPVIALHVHRVTPASQHVRIVWIVGLCPFDGYITPLVIEDTDNLKRIDVNVEGVRPYDVLP